MTRAYYNEIDPYAAEWLRNLIMVDLIAPGDVDTRSIEDVTPEDLSGYTQCHFFAGIGGWSLALRLAGWPDDRPVWTGSCPCQPFSAAGQRAGVADERHLWPAWQWLIEQCRPRVIFGEQVEAAIKHDWLDLVQTDLEGLGYATGSICLPAAGVGAPHGRSRLWFVADARCSRSEYLRYHLGEPQGADQGEGDQRQRVRTDARHGELGHADDAGSQGRRVSGAVGERNDSGQRAAGPAGADVGMADSERGVGDGRADLAERGPEERDADRRVGSTYWSACDQLPCRDGKARPVEPGTFPLAHGVSARVGRLRAYGNAIVPQVAAEVIRAYMECRP